MSIVCGVGERSLLCFPYLSLSVCPSFLPSLSVSVCLSLYLYHLSELLALALLTFAGRASERAGNAGDRL